MNANIQTITLDLTNSAFSAAQKVSVVQGDSGTRPIKAIITDNGVVRTDLSHDSARIYISNAPGEPPTYVEGILINGGVAEFCIPQSATLQPGIKKGELRIVGVNEKVLSSMPFMVEVNPSQYDENALLGTDNGDVLERMVEETSENKFAAAESAEAARISAEAADDAARAAAESANRAAQNGSTDAVSYSQSQNLTDEQKGTARQNIGVFSQNQVAQMINGSFEEAVPKSLVVDNLVADKQLLVDHIPNGQAVQSFIEANAVSSAVAQTLSDSKKQIARTNIGAISQAELDEAIANAGGSGSNVPVEINSWSVVQQMVRLGIAAKVFSIGDQLVCNHETYGTLVWDIIGIDHDTPANSEFKHSLTIQLHDCIAVTFQFDAAEPTNPDSDRKSDGSNNWLESGIRQWLNSDGNAGTWWEAKTDYDVKPSYASTAGFLKGLDAEFLSTVGEVSKITARDTVIDGGGSDTSTEKFFLLSVTEVYGGLNNKIAEGVAYPYYADNSVLSAAGTGKDINRIKYRSGAAQFWWLRSPSASYSYFVWGVHATGTVSRSAASYKNGVAPACCII